MTFNPHAATVDEMRQWILLREWRPPFTFDDSGVSSTAWERRDGKPSGLSWHEEPTIPATLDWVASHLERCFYYEISKEGNERNPWIGAFALHENGMHPTVIEAKTRLECEFRLLCLVLMAEDASKGKEENK